MHIPDDLFHIPLRIDPTLSSRFRSTKWIIITNFKLKLSDFASIPKYYKIIKQLVFFINWRSIEQEPWAAISLWTQLNHHFLSSSSTGTICDVLLAPLPAPPGGSFFSRAGFQELRRRNTFVILAGASIWPHRGCGGFLWPLLCAKHALDICVVAGTFCWAVQSHTTSEPARSIRDPLERRRLTMSEFLTNCSREGLKSRALSHADGWKYKCINE